MGVIIDFFRDNVILILTMVLVVTILIRLFWGNGKAQIIAVGLVILIGGGTAILLDIMKYTTFEEAFSDQIQEDTDIDSIMIITYNTTGRQPESERAAVIEDEVLIDEIMGELQGLKLKKQTLMLRSDDWDYHLLISARNRISESHYQTSNLQLNLGQDYINNYKVVSREEYLDTIRNLGEDGELEWTY